MDITENTLQQIIIEELKEVLGMDQEYTGSEMDVDAENDLSGALMTLQKAGYSRQEVLDMVNDAYDFEPERVQDEPLREAGLDETEEPMEEDCGCPSCPEHGPGAKIRVKFR